MVVDLVQGGDFEGWWYLFGDDEELGTVQLYGDEYFVELASMRFNVLKHLEILEGVKVFFEKYEWDWDKLNWRMK